MDQARFEEIKQTLIKFMHEDIYPNEVKFFRQQHKTMLDGPEHWEEVPLLRELQAKAKKLGLWNLFLPVDSAMVAGVKAGGLTNRQYAEVCEIMGTSNHIEFAAQATNCTSPDTGNMEVLARFGTPEQRQKWLIPLLNGEIRSCFGMTEPDVASSDASNIGINIAREGDEYVINGRKWWITGAGNKDCKIMILMGKTDPKASAYRQQSQILVPMDTPGITLVRPMQTFGDIDAPKGHMELLMENVRVPVSNVVLGEGRGFEIAQARLGPGRIHHCMRLIGQAERALSHMVQRTSYRKAFGRNLNKFANIRQDIAQSRAEIDQARYLVHDAADRMDKMGNKDPRTRQILAMCKAVVPSMCQRVVDRAIQAHGGMGVSQDTFLPAAWVAARTLRLADGPDEVHWMTTAKIEMKNQQKNHLSKIQPYVYNDPPFRVNAKL